MKKLILVVSVAIYAAFAVGEDAKDTSGLREKYQDLSKKMDAEIAGIAWKEMSLTQAPQIGIKMKDLSSEKMLIVSQAINRRLFGVGIHVDKVKSFVGGDFIETVTPDEAGLTLAIIRLLPVLRKPPEVDGSREEIIDLGWKARLKVDQSGIVQEFSFQELKGK